MPLLVPWVSFGNLLGFFISSILSISYCQVIIEKTLCYLATTDWEAIADRTPDELLSSQSLPGVSKFSLEDTKVQAPKQRGRGTFAYKKHELYSDQLSSKIVVDNDSLEEESECHNLEGGEETRNCKLIFPLFKSPILGLRGHNSFTSCGKTY